MTNILSIMSSFSIEKTPTDVLLELAEKVRKLRKDQKLTQLELAKRANVSLGSYKRFEHTGHVSLDALLRIAFILGRLDDFETVFKPSSTVPDIKQFL